MKIIKLVTLLCFLIPITSFAQDQTIMVNGKSRSMVVYAPKNLAQNRPLVIACHGSGASGPEHARWRPFTSIADTARFVVVYPTAIGGSWDLSGNSDIDFMSAIIVKMYEQYKIDKNRVYINGFSLGGMFTYHAANKMANKIAAFGAASGYPLWGANFTSSRPIPLIHIHGDKDDFVKYSGVQAIIDGWVKRNNITAPVKITSPYPVGRSNTNTKKYYGPGTCRTEVVFITVAGLGHSTESSSNFNTNNEFWKFSSRFPLNMPCTITGLEDESKSDATTDEILGVFSNPTSTDFTIEHKGAFDYIIYNMEGLKLQEGASNGKATLGSSLPQGIYVVKIKDDFTEKTMKLVKNQ
ncbi:MAG: T9SS type A sorting domain-containing protein [Opitutaceae bacterium]|nr:T9SS type A sorting domain-containing protein [Cytophagales bacterium]